MHRLLPPVALVVCLIALPALAAGRSRSLELSRDLWLKKCALCHGDGGEGPDEKDPHEPIPDFRSGAWQAKHKDAELRHRIGEGVEKTRMRPFKEKLSAREIQGLVALIRSFKSRP